MRSSLFFFHYGLCGSIRLSNVAYLVYHAKGCCDKMGALLCGVILASQTYIRCTSSTLTTSLEHEHSALGQGGDHQRVPKKKTAPSSQPESSTYHHRCYHCLFMSAKDSTLSATAGSGHKLL